MAWRRSRAHHRHRVSGRIPAGHPGSGRDAAVGSAQRASTENLTGSRRLEETTSVSGGVAPFAGLIDIRAKEEVSFRRRVLRAKAFGASRIRPSGDMGDGAHNKHPAPFSGSQPSTVALANGALQTGRPLASTKKTVLAESVLAESESLTVGHVAQTDRFRLRTIPTDGNSCFAST